MDLAANIDMQRLFPWALAVLTSEGAQPRRAFSSNCPLDGMTEGKMEKLGGSLFCAKIGLKMRLSYVILFLKGPHFCGNATLIQIKRQERQM